MRMLEHEPNTNVTQLDGQKEDLTQLRLTLPKRDLDELVQEIVSVLCPTVCKAILLVLKAQVLGCIQVIVVRTMRSGFGEDTSDSEKFCLAPHLLEGLQRHLQISNADLAWQLLFEMK